MQSGDYQLRQQLDYTMKERDYHVTKNEQLQAQIFEQESRIAEQEKFIRTQLQQISRNPGQAGSGQAQLVYKEREIMQLSYKLRYAQTQLEMVKAERPRVSEAFRYSHCEESSYYMSKTDLEDTPGPEDLDALRFLYEERSRLTEELERLKLENYRVNELYYKILAEQQITKQYNEQLASANAEISQVLIALDSYVKDKSLLDSKLQKITEDYNGLLKKNAVYQAQLTVEAEKSQKVLRDVEYLTEKLEKKTHQHATLEQGYFELDKEYQAILKRLRAADDELSILRKNLADCASYHEKDAVKIEMLQRYNAEYLEAIKHDLSEVNMRNDYPQKQSGIEMLEEYHAMVRELREYLAAKDVLLERLSVSHTSHARETTPSPNTSAVNEDELHYIIYEYFVQIYELTAELECVRKYQSVARGAEAQKEEDLLPKLRMLGDYVAQELYQNLDRLHAQMIQRLGQISEQVEYIVVLVLEKHQVTSQIVTDNMRLSRGFEHLMTDNETQVSAIFEHVEYIAGAVRSLCPSFSLSGANFKLPPTPQSVTSTVSLEDVRGNLEQIQEVLQRMAALYYPNVPTYYSYDELLASALALTAQRNDLQQETYALKYEIERYKYDLKDAYLKYLYYDYQCTDFKYRLKAGDLHEMQTALENAERYQCDFRHALEIKAYECALLENEMYKLKAAGSFEQSVELYKYQHVLEENISKSVYAEEQSVAIDAYEDVAYTSAVHQDVVQSHALTSYYQHVATILQQLSHEMAEAAHFVALNKLEKRIYQIEVMCKPVYTKLAMVDKYLIDLISAQIHYNFVNLYSNDMGYKEILEEQKYANYRLLQLYQQLMEYLSQRSPQEYFDISLCMSQLQEIYEDKDQIVEKLKKYLQDKIEQVEQLSSDKLNIAENVRCLEEQLYLAETAARDADQKAKKVLAYLADSATIAEEMQKDFDRKLAEVLEKEYYTEAKYVQLYARSYGVEAYNYKLEALKDEMQYRYSYLSAELVITEKSNLVLYGRLEELLQKEAHSAVRLNDTLNELTTRNSQIVYLYAYIYQQSEHDYQLEYRVMSEHADDYNRMSILQVEKNELEKQVQQLYSNISEQAQKLTTEQKLRAEHGNELQKELARSEAELQHYREEVDYKTRYLAEAMDKLKYVSIQVIEAEKQREVLVLEKYRMEEYISALQIATAELQQEKYSLTKATTENLAYKYMAETQNVYLTEKYLEIDNLKRDIHDLHGKETYFYAAVKSLQYEQDYKLYEGLSNYKTISELKERIGYLTGETASLMNSVYEKNKEIEQKLMAEDKLKQQLGQLYTVNYRTATLDDIWHTIRFGETFFGNMSADKLLTDTLTTRLPYIMKKLDSIAVGVSLAQYHCFHYLLYAKEEAKSTHLENNQQLDTIVCTKSDIAEAFLAHELKIDEIKGTYNDVTDILRYMREYLQKAFSETAAYLSNGFSAITAMNIAVRTLLEEVVTRENLSPSFAEHCNAILERISSEESGIYCVLKLLYKHAAECAYSMQLLNDVKMGGKSSNEDIYTLYSAVSKIDAKMDGYFYSEYVLQLKDILTALQRQNSLSASDTPQSLHGNSLSISSPAGAYRNTVPGQVNGTNSLGYDYLSHVGDYSQHQEHFSMQSEVFPRQNDPLSQIYQPQLPPTQVSYNMASGMEIGRLNLRIGQLEAYLVQLQGAKTAAASYSEELLRRENSRLESDLKHTLLEYDLLRKYITEYKLQIQAYEMTLGEQREEILTLRGTGYKYDALCRQKDLYDEQLYSLRAAFAEIRALVYAHFGDNRDIIQQIENLLAAKRQIIDLEAKNVDLESRLKAADDERKSFRRRAREERDQKERIQRAVKQLELKVERQNQQLEKYRDDVREIRYYAYEYASAVQEELKSRIG